MDDKRLHKLKELIKLVDESITRDEFLAAFKKLMDYVEKQQKSNKDELVDVGADLFKKFEELKAEFDSSFAAHTEALSSTEQTTIAHLESKMAELETLARARIAEHDTLIHARLAELKDGQAPPIEIIVESVKPHIPPPIPGSPDTSEDIRNKLELLEDDERLKIEAIKDLREELDKLRKLRNEIRGGGNNHPLYALMDVSIAGITAGQTIEWDGIKWVAVTPAGGGGTPVWGEDLSSQGPGTAFTLANTPIAGTVRLFRGGAYQQAGAGNDYTISGSNIVLAVALQDGEKLTTDYSK